MKKINLLLITILITTSFSLTAQVAVTPDGSSADASAMMDVKSTDKGMLIPRMTANERDLIGSPATGLLVYVTGDNNFYYYDGAAWKQFSGGSDGDWIVNGSNMSSAVSGNVGIGQPNPSEKLDVNGTIKGTNFSGNGSTLTFGASSNMQPSLGISYIISLNGVYPSQSKGIDPYIGEIAMFAGNFAPQGWAFCDGQLLQISQYTALFSLIGTYYGGNGYSTFALPDLRGRVPVHHGTGPGLTTRNIGQAFGVEKVGQ
ncbi:MAG: tail fiber protein [Bacteroidales bacterium]|nr:tail fiber protein [Bacteroidales bacterium]MCF8403381.1 tail fiber protein [Bacteroidales bacterium]